MCFQDVVMFFFRALNDIRFAITLPGSIIVPLENFSCKPFFFTKELHGMRIREKMPFGTNTVNRLNT